MEAMKEPEFDIVIIGAGLGGLLSAALLSKEGFRVMVLEKNKQAGGALQSFGIHGQRFESAVHYIGSMKPGETLFQLYNYLGIADKLELHPLEESCYDEIILGERSYKLAQHHERFIQTLAQDFPEERNGIQQFVATIQYTCNHFPLYQMRVGSPEEKQKVIYRSLKEVLEKYISNPILRQVLCGNNMLFAGQYNTTPFYIYALIQNSYIESSFKLAKGSAQLTKLLQEVIVEQGGVVKRNVEVVSFQEVDGLICSVQDADGNQYAGKQFISNLHPAETYRLVSSHRIRPVTRKRIEATQNTLSAFMVNLVLKEKRIPYVQHNIYYHKERDVWKDVENLSKESPNAYGIYFYPDEDAKYAMGLSILTYMHEKEVPCAISSYRNTSKPDSRGLEYETWKESKINQLVSEVESVVPGLKESILHQEACTPLTYRDYLHTPEGSMYGVQKQVDDLSNTTYSSRTKIPNLYLTGQNINLHGVLGVSITAVLTAAELVGLEYLVDKIKKAN